MQNTRRSEREAKEREPQTSRSRGRERKKKKKCWPGILACLVGVLIVAKDQRSVWQKGRKKKEAEKTERSGELAGGQGAEGVSGEEKSFAERDGRLLSMCRRSSVEGGLSVQGGRVYASVKVVGYV